MGHDCGALIKAIDAYIAKADNDLEDMLNAAGFAEAKDSIESITNIEELVVAALKAETKHILDSLDETLDLHAYARDVWPGVVLDDKLAEQLQQIFIDEFTSLMPGLVNTYIAKIDNELVALAISQRTTDWITSWSKDLGELMQLKSHAQIEDILTSGLSTGQSIADITRAILDSGIRDEYYRARTVAVTEVLRAHSVAEQEALMQCPVAVEKEWLHTGAHKNTPRENHVAMSGQRVPVGEPFTLTGINGVYYPLYPRDICLPPEEAIGCHCIHRGVASELILGLPVEERRALQQQAIDEDDSLWRSELDAANRAKAGIE